jgi:hypothetical protein
MDQLVRLLVVEPVQPGLSHRLGTGARIFLDLFQDLKALCFQLCHDDTDLSYPLSDDLLSEIKIRENISAFLE